MKSLKNVTIIESSIRYSRNIYKVNNLLYSKIFQGRRKNTEIILVIVIIVVVVVIVVFVVTVVIVFIVAIVVIVSNCNAEIKSLTY